MACSLVARSGLTAAADGVSLFTLKAFAVWFVRGNVQTAKLFQEMTGAALMSPGHASIKPSTEESRNRRVPLIWPGSRSVRVTIRFPAASS